MPGGTCFCAKSMIYYYVRLILFMAFGGVRRGESNGKAVKKT